MKMFTYQFVLIQDEEVQSIMTAYDAWNEKSDLYKDEEDARRRGEYLKGYFFDKDDDQYRVEVRTVPFTVDI